MSKSSSSSDLIIVNDLAVHAPLGPTRWPKPGSEKLAQPLLITAKASVSVSQAGISDQLQDSVNYSSLAKVLDSTAKEPGAAYTLETLADAICTECFAKFPSIDAITVSISKKAGLLHAERLSYELRCAQNPHGFKKSTTYSVTNLLLSAIIGIHPWERAEKQVVRLNLDLEASVDDTSASSDYPDIRSLVQSVSEVGFYLFFISKSTLF